ncbi:hypothetical protein [Phormidesmis priestleyi]
MRKLLLLPMLLAACSPSPSGVVDRYLKAIQSGNSDEQRKLSCVTVGDIKSEIKSAPSWTIVGEQTRDAEEGISYKIVTVKIGDQSFEIQVWKTDDAYKTTHRVVERLKLKGLEIEDPAPERSQWSRETFCVSPQGKKE